MTIEFTPTMVVQLTQCITVMGFAPLHNIFYIKRRVRGRQYDEVPVPRNTIYVLYRQYRKHNFNPNFTNIICRIKTIDGVSQKFCLVINEWKGDEEKLTISSHGNSKFDSAKSTPFIRSEQKLLKSMENGIKSGTTPQEVYHRNIKSSGGPFQVQSQSQTPKNKKRVF